MAELAGGGKLIQRNASTASTESDHVVINMKRTIESSEYDHLKSRCIYKVPDHLRKLNESFFTPQVISIGPLHHGNKKLQNMENYKKKYLKDFLERSQTKLEDLEFIVKSEEHKVRECYAENITLYTDEFVQMILRDATFIIEYFLRNRFPEQYWTAEDEILFKPWLTARMQLDFLLIENQLPFVIIDELYQLLLFTDTLYPPLIEVTLYYFEFFNTQSYKPSDLRSHFQIMHFVDLLRCFYLPPPQRGFSRKCGNHFGEEYCASQLAEVGLVFKKSTSRCQLDIIFKDGVLEIPGFTLDKDTELYARNLMALELLHYPKQAYITDYFCLLDFLIDTNEDVGLLRRKKILVNRLGDKCATVVNNLSSNVVDTPLMNSIYYDVCQQLVHFYDNPWNSWKVKLRRDLNTPWVIVTAASAFFLLGLNVVQTVFTIISTVKST